MANDSHLEGIPMAIFANKQDLPGSMDLVKCKEVFNRCMDSIGVREYRLFATSGLTGDGVQPAFDWLCTQVMRNAPQRPPH